MSRDLRRQTLLEVAAGIVEREGWPALTMSALADQGGTSRQLVYQHFPSLEKLLADTSWHIFTDTMLGTQASIAAHPTSLAEAVTAAEAVTLDLPPGRGDALWQLIAGTASTTEELDQMRRGMREVITGIWMPLVRKELGLKEADAKAYAWMMVIAFWGMRQLVRDGDVTRARGVKLFGQMVERLGRP
ncbi:TetR/AcrR family transcriptional regulator [Solimonas terrae]|uniref:TetR/AcrR family transcriptional regulator n=1 Tax=Solimonas terrae TaxID=1396819 RepID=A0A6M2BNK0_9GAMM|nr:TetR/AcrR family transcriptional regulator [Solimonas terrae]NGY03791.1 TetR/AcrR family transcriptional regulator [Solimonas terrae]